MKRFSLCVFVLVLGSGGFAQNNSDAIVFQHANVIDGISNKPLMDVTVTIENGRIVSVGRYPKSTPPGAEVIDLKGKWVMPGFVDAHVHFATFDAARTALLLGATTVRTMQCDHFLDIKIRDAHRRGEKDLPDVIAAGYQVRPDMFAAFFADFPELADIQGGLSGNENVRRVVKAIVSRGVDHIKFLATERAGTPETDPRRQTFTDDEAIAIVDEARRAGLYVAAHAHGDEGAYAAVTAGVRSIEHGTFMTTRTLKLMKRKGTFFVVTSTGGSQPPARVADINNPILQDRRRTFLIRKNELIQQAVQLGIPMAAGTDLRYTTADLSMADEALSMNEAGLDAMTILKIMTVGSAKCLGIDKRTGAIKKGLEADIIVLIDNPLSSLEALKKIRMIVNDGKVVLRKI